MEAKTRRTILQVRKNGKQWLITGTDNDSPLGGPDRMGEHSMSFDSLADATHAAQWRIEHLEDGDGKVEKGPTW